MEIKAIGRYVAFGMLCEEDKKNIVKGFMQKYGIEEQDARFRAGLMQYLAVEEADGYHKI